MQGHIPCEVATDRVAYGLYSKFDFERQMDSLSKSEGEISISVKIS